MIDDPRAAQTYPDVLDEATFLGPAAVIAARAGRIEVTLPSGETVKPPWLWRGVPLNEGDSVLVVGRRKVISSLVCSRPSAGTLRFFGMWCCAPSRANSNCWAKEVSVRSNDVRIEAGAVRTIAESVVERAATAYQHIREVLSVHAGEKREVVRGEWLARAERANIVTSETVSINGKEIHLG